MLDTQSWNIEEFGLPLNLMLSVLAPLVVGDARAALVQLRRYQAEAQDRLAAARRST